MTMTVYDRVAADIKGGTMITESAAAPCAICERHQFLRYGCCLDCARSVSIDDPRLEGYPRVGGKEADDVLVGHRTPTDHCPRCEYQVSGATAVDGSDVKPEPGDYSVCFDCGEMLEFTGDLHVIPLSATARSAIPRNTMSQLLRAQAHIRTRGRLPRTVRKP